MAEKKVRLTKAIRTNKNDPDILREVIDHYNQWTEDNEQRRTRKNGWNDVTDAYYGKLPDDWPYISRVVDPRIRTTVIEKNARLLNSKLRGRLVPREGGDVLKARLNNTILDFQWDSANHGGTMLEKWGTMDQDTRLYASKFALVCWKHETDDEGKVTFSGNEFIPLDIRDCGMDMGCNNIRDAKWFQYREWLQVSDLDKDSSFDEVYDDGSKRKKKLYPGVGQLKAKMAERSDRRDNAYDTRILTLKGLPDRVGDDKAFPVVEIVTELRGDRQITFSPRYKVVLRDIPNPYWHKKINVVQLKYHSIQGDPIGESEVEPVLPIWKAIQATVCGFLDELNIRLRPPLKILEGKARIETIVFAPEAQWIVDQIDAVTEHQTSNTAINTFQTTYSSLIAAFNAAMGDLSQGTSSIDPFNPGKTATEVRASVKQQNTRDQKNQTSLAEAIQDMMSMWLINNRQFLFADPDKHEHVLRIVGDEMYNYFKRAGLDEMELTEEGMILIGDIIQQQGGNMSDEDLMQLTESAKVPRHPVYTNPNEEDPEKIEAQPKMRINETNDGAELSIVPEDLDGAYDYIADTKSMSAGASEEMIQAQQNALTVLTGNPTVLQLLQGEGVTPNIKEMLISTFEGAGLRDAERFFTTVQPQGVLPQGASTGGGPQQPQQLGSIPAELEATIAAGDPSTMAGPSQVQGPAGIPGGVQPSIQ